MQPEGQVALWSMTNVRPAGASEGKMLHGENERLNVETKGRSHDAHTHRTIKLSILTTGTVLARSEAERMLDAGRGAGLELD